MTKLRRRGSGWLLGASVLLALLLSMPHSSPLLADSVNSKIVEVADNGDLIFANGKRLRLQGVDLPSTWSCFGEQRLRYMKENLEGKSASYRIEKSDLMGKPLVYVDVQGDVGSDLIRAGYAFALLSFEYEKQDSYKRTMEYAKDNLRGLWVHCEVECDKRGCKTNSSIFSCSGKK